MKLIDIIKDRIPVGGDHGKDFFVPEGFRERQG